MVWVVKDITIFISGLIALGVGGGLSLHLGSSRALGSAWGRMRLRLSRPPRRAYRESLATGRWHTFSAHGENECGVMSRDSTEL